MIAYISYVGKCVVETVEGELAGRFGIDKSSITGKDRVKFALRRYLKIEDSILRKKV